MPNIRVTSPRDGLHNTATINGRTYTCAQGSTIDIPDHDAIILCANGWRAIPDIKTNVGTTAARPTRHPDGRFLEAGVTFLDTTVGGVISYDGSAWRNASGAVV